MKPLRRLVLLVSLAAGLSALSGCGGGVDDTPDGQPLPASSNLDSTYEGLDVGLVAPTMLVLQAHGEGQRSYSRRGRLGLSHDGRLIHEDGAWVMGLGADPGSGVAPLPKAPLTMPARVTSRLAIVGNLDSRMQPRWVETVDPLDPSTYHSAASVFIWTPDPRVVILYFVKRQDLSPDDWMIRATIDGRLTQAEHVLRFAPQGVPMLGASTTLIIPAGDEGLASAVEVDLSGFTQYGSSFSITELSQDGWGAGVLQGAQIGNDGRLSFQYGNGQTAPGGTVVLARFTVADRLHRVGHSTWICGVQCQPPMIGAPGSALMGPLYPGSLNTDY